MKIVRVVTSTRISFARAELYPELTDTFQVSEAMWDEYVQASATTEYLENEFNNTFYTQIQN